MLPTFLKKVEKNFQNLKKQEVNYDDDWRGDDVANGYFLFFFKRFMYIY